MNRGEEVTAAPACTDPRLTLAVYGEVTPQLMSRQPFGSPPSCSERNTNRARDARATRSPL
jgi:hypothetical protein